MIDASNSITGLFTPITLILSVFFFFHDLELVTDNLVRKFKGKKKKKKIPIY